METSHVSALHTKHAGLERRIAEELLRPAPDENLVMELKKRKLRIKEELAQSH
ncbi:YdcH family protein [Novosphingobium sp. KCTC 2891]|uniref:YdcH family protein n=1 Tax=Novosphingobium sp. KCTC 2891 TaxID=2989730 RepID=UPI0022234E27|nr:YdcH family protein [Novosphingobium sp. KCTC 2891]MCW1382296.1 YdcH family protein [Novosphingobium sp. KCTC 2891]